MGDEDEFFPTLTCPAAPHGHHLTLGQACLEVASGDAHNTLKLWAQAEECYKCPPWYFLTLPPEDTQTLIVNTTYLTNLFITKNDDTDLYSLQYHFREYGNYHLRLGEKVAEIEVTRQPENEYLPLLTAALFYLLLAFMWQCAKFLVRRMDSSAASPELRRRTTSDPSERRPLVSSMEEPQPSTSTEPQPSTSSHPSTSSQPSSTQHSASLASTVLASEQLASPLHSNQSLVQTFYVTRDLPLPLPDARRESGRLLSLDAFRGLAIVLMIFVNYGGGHYSFFKHAPWNGITVADLVFPWFLWIMGVSLVFSVRSQLRRTTKRIIIVLRILKRCIILFALGLIVNSTNGNNYMPTFRIFGVLQRFAICYLLTAVIEVYVMNPQESPEYVWYWKVRDLVRSSPQWVFTLVLVTMQVVLTFGLSVPGCPKGYLGPGGLHEWGMYRGCTGGAAGYIDRVFVGEKHVYAHPTCAKIYASNTPYDPEGLLGALTSVLMVQFGAACGRIIITFETHWGRVMRWLAWAGVTGLMAGFLCGWRKEGGLIPVNKNLWSLSYVLCTASFAFILFTVFYLLIDQRKWWSGNPLRYAGMNAIFLYVGHEVFGGLFPWSWRPVGQHHANYLVMNLWATSSWIIIAYLCHRRKLYFSV